MDSVSDGTYSVSLVSVEVVETVVASDLMDITEKKRFYIYIARRAVTNSKLKEKNHNHLQVL